MGNGVDEWVQEGRLCVWRYADANNALPGWQWSGDPDGCRSVRNLLDRMQGGAPCHRILRLIPMTQDIADLPAAGHRVAERFSRLRIDHRPDVDALRAEPDGEMLVVTAGGRRLHKLAAAFGWAELGREFDIDPGLKADPWMFWGMPDVTY